MTVTGRIIPNEALPDNGIGTTEKPWPEIIAVLAKLMNLEVTEDLKIMHEGELTDIRDIFALSSDTLWMTAGSYVKPQDDRLVDIPGGVENTLPVYSDPIVDETSVWTSTGWTGDWETGFTHTTGNLEPLILETALTQGTRYFFSVTTTGGLSPTTATLDIDGRFLSGRNPSISWGFIVAGASSKITVTPDQTNWIGKVVVRLYEYVSEAYPYVILGNRDMEIRNTFFSGAMSSSFIGRNNGQWCSGRQNTGYGLDTLTLLTTGSFNTAFGYNALQRVDTGNGNIGVGRACGRNMTSAVDNIAIGNGALHDHVNGVANICLGGGGMYRNISGIRNIVLGHRGLLFNAAGDRNITIGYEAGFRNMGSRCIFIGDGCGSVVGGADVNSDDILMIDVSQRNDPLIWGDFVAREIRINGELEVDDELRILGSGSQLHIGSEQSSCSIFMQRSGATTPIEFRSGGTGVTVYNCTMFAIQNGTLSANKIRTRYLETANSYDWCQALDTGVFEGVRYAKVSFGHDINTTTTGVDGYYVTFFGGLENDYVNALFKASNGQTANLTEWEDEAGVTKLKVDADGELVTHEDSFQYWGDKETDGTWRMGRVGDDFVIQVRQTGTYATKLTINP